MVSIITPRFNKACKKKMRFKDAPIPDSGCIASFLNLMLACVLPVISFNLSLIYLV